MIRVLIVDDHAVFREGLAALLVMEDDLTVVGEAGDGREAVTMSVELSPDIVLMDIAMDTLNGIDATQQIVGECESTRVIGLSFHVGHRIITQLLKAGASGYVPKRAALDEIVKAIRSVASGSVYVSQFVASDVILGYIRSDGEAFGKRLTPREREVLQLVAEGKSTKEIAAGLHLSAKTVETHRKHLMDKLELPSVAQLTKYAIREGISRVDT